ncbi:hypothetical protein D3C76_1085900 [compost metagenome]
MRIELIHPFRLANTHHIQHLQHFGFRLRLAPRMVGQPGLGDLIPDADHRVQGVLWILHDHRDALAANAAHLGFADAAQIDVAELHPGGGDLRLCRVQAQQRPPDGGFARAGLADNRQLLAPELKGDAAHRVGHRASVDKVDVQIAHVQQWRISCCEDRGCHVGHLLRS